MADERQKKGEQKSLLKPRRYEGILMYEHEHEEIASMETFDEDVWVCSFPRSGTTLTQELTYLVKTLDFKTASEVRLDVRFPMLDSIDESMPYYKGLKNLENLWPRFMKVHMHYFMLPKQLKEGKGKIIYISRNPKDVVCSFQKLMAWQGLFGKENFDDFVDNFVKGTGPYCPWQKHVLGYWENRDKPNVLFLKYEDVIHDMPGAVRKIAEYLGRHLSDDDVTKICKFCHVDEMRERATVNLEYWREYKTLNDESGCRFINKGQAGVWREMLSEEKSSRIDGMLKDLEGTGLSFDHC